MENKTINQKVVLNQYQLEKLVRGVAMEIWNETVDIPIEKSSRLTSTFGYFRSTMVCGKRTANKLTFAQRMLDGDYKLSTIIDVIKHELTHYLLFKKGESGYHDGDRTFENELIKVGAYSTRTITSPGLKHVANCSCCGKMVSEGTEGRIKKLCNTSRWISKCCNAKLSYAGTIYIEDNTPIRSAACEEFDTRNLKIVNNIFDETPAIVNKPIKVQPIEKAVKTAASLPAVVTTVSINDILPEVTGKVTGNKIFKTVANLLKNKEEQKLLLINDTYPEAMKICINEKYLGKTKYAYAKQIGL